MLVRIILFGTVVVPSDLVYCSSCYRMLALCSFAQRPNGRHNKPCIINCIVYVSVFSNVTGWGALGLCWGGKVAVLFSGPSSVLKATAQVHPG